MPAQHPNGTALDCSETEPTAIRVPPMHASSEVTFSLEGPDVFVEVKLHYSTQVNRSFPGDVAGAPRLDSLHHLAAADWLPTPFSSYPLDEPWLNNVVQQTVRGGELDGIPAEEWLRRHAERYLNEVCTEIRCTRAADPLLTRRMAEHAERDRRDEQAGRQGDRPTCDIDDEGRLNISCMGGNSMYEGPWVRES